MQRRKLLKILLSRHNTVYILKYMVPDFLYANKLHLFGIMLCTCFVTWFKIFFWVFVFLNYILLIMLLQLSQFFPLCPPPPRTPRSLRQSPHHCSCPWVMCISSLATPFAILYFTPPWLLCNYLSALLNPLTSSPIPPQPPPVWQPSQCSLYAWLWFLSLLFCDYISMPRNTDLNSYLNRSANIFCVLPLCQA